MNWKRYCQKAIWQYYTVHDPIPTIVTDANYIIQHSNGAAIAMTGLPGLVNGADLLAYLSPDSIVALKTIESECRTVLMFGKMPQARRCECYISRDHGWMTILAASQFVQQNDIVQVMSTINCELSNTTRELSKSRRKVEAINRQLATEVQERKQIEAALRQSEEKYRELVEDANVIIINFDRQGTILFINEFGLQLFGYTWEELVGRSFKEMLLPVMDLEGKNVWSAFDEMWVQSEPYQRRVHEHVNKVGERIWIEWVNRVQTDGRDILLHIVSVGLDVTERKKTEQGLKESEERYRTLMMQSYEAVVLIDIETYEIVEGNRRFEELLGYCFSDDRPLRVDEVFADSKLSIKKMFELLRRDGSLPHIIRPLRTKDGKLRLVERAGSLIRIAGRDYQITTLRDVTEEQQRQEEMKKDLAFASQVQVALLPTLPQTELFQIQTLFRPASFVSGDLYHLEWLSAKLLLRGYLVDVAGHGLATAIQTAAVNVLLHEAAELPISIAEQLSWLNCRVSKYFDEAAFAAALAFEMDFAAGELRYSAAGIADFLFNKKRISTPGMFLGVNEQETFDTWTLPFLPGDAICFMTDGISEKIAESECWGKINARNICYLFSENTLPERLRDDSTAICISVLDLHGRLADME